MVEPPVVVDPKEGGSTGIIFVGFLIVILLIVGIGFYLKKNRPTVNT